METYESTEKQEAAELKKRYVTKVILIIVLILVLWLTGIGNCVNRYLINNHINSSITDEKNYICETNEDCVVKNICGEYTHCMNRDFEVLCLPQSPLINWIKKYQNRYASLYRPRYRPSEGCYCINNRCRYETDIWIGIESVWNNNGKISLAIRNIGNYVLSRDVKKISLYIGGVPKDISDDCVNHLNDEGSACQIDTDVDFPTIVGSDGEVFIQVKPPFGRRGAYTCAIRRLGDKSC